MIDDRLQLKPGQTIAPIGNPAPLPVAATRAGKLTWIAYPKAKQLGTDINRDTVRDIANQNGLDPVRQVAIDDAWSALRFKAL